MVVIMVIKLAFYLLEPIYIQLSNKRRKIVMFKVFTQNIFWQLIWVYNHERIGLRPADTVIVNGVLKIKKNVLRECQEVSGQKVRFFFWFYDQTLCY